jgi:UDP-N-acetylmuramoyl-tripeptide--D-alanyl-D-alanine ligase
MKSTELLELYLSSTGVSIDSRNLVPGNIFFAIIGDRFDGHNFVEEVIEKGAKAAIISKEINFKDSKIIVVKDTLQALQDLARDYRDYLNIPVISLTGSNGKTTTKELLYLILSKKYNAFATKGNLNNHLGVPLSLLAIKPDHEIAIIEMGANHRNEISELVQIAKPNLGLITNIGHAHLEGFGSREGIAFGKFELFDYLIAKNCLIIYRGDSFMLSDMANHYTNSIVIDSQMVKIHDEYLQFVNVIEQPFVSFIFKWRGKEYKVESHLYGKHNYENIILAVVVGLLYEVNPNDIASAVSHYQPANNRSQILEIGNSIVYLDAYNANPDSMKAAILSFRTIATSSSLIILGEMKELGDFSQNKHQELLDLIHNSFTNYTPSLWLYGTSWQSCDFYKGTFYFTDFYSIKDKWSKEGLNFDRVLIKGSRSNRLEELLQ